MFSSQDRFCTYYVEWNAHYSWLREWESPSETLAINLSSLHPWKTEIGSEVKAIVSASSRIRLIGLLRTHFQNSSLQTPCYISLQPLLLTFHMSHSCYFSFNPPFPGIFKLKEWLIAIYINQIKTGQKIWGCTAAKSSQVGISALKKSPRLKQWRPTLQVKRGCAYKRNLGNSLSKPHTV